MVNFCSLLSAESGRAPHRARDAMAQQPPRERGDKSFDDFFAVVAEIDGFGMGTTSKAGLPKPPSHAPRSEADASDVVQIDDSSPAPPPTLAYETDDDEVGSSAGSSAS